MPLNVVITVELFSDTADNRVLSAYILLHLSTFFNPIFHISSNLDIAPHLIVYLRVLMKAAMSVSIPLPSPLEREGILYPSQSEKRR